MNVEGVPEFITRERYVEMIESLGFDVKLLREMEWRPDGIYATVCATDEQGNVLLDSQRNGVVEHRVFVQVRDF